jgi:SAM-dependent methyltransferase
MTKLAEMDYLDKIGEAGRHHSIEKPFSDLNCGFNLASIGVIMNLLPKPPGRLLDFGCGAGWTSVFMAKYGFEVVGQDISSAMLAAAAENRDRYNLTNLSFVKGDYESINFRDEFDCAMFYDCLHHADDELAAIRTAYNALKPGGVLITHEPGVGHAANPASIEAMRVYGVNERDMPPSLIIRRGQEVGFTDCRVFPMQHDVDTIFYGALAPKFLSRAGLHYVKRLLRIVFMPYMEGGAIVRMRKPL